MRARGRVQNAQSVVEAAQVEERVREGDAGVQIVRKLDQNWKWEDVSVREKMFSWQGKTILTRSVLLS